VFVRAFTSKQLEQGFFLGKIRDMWKTFKVDLNSIESNLYRDNDLIKYDSQISNKAFILKHKDLNV